MTVQDTEEVAPPQSIARRRRRGPPAVVWAQVVIAIGVLLVLCWVAKVVLITLIASAVVAFMLAPLVAVLVRLHVPRAVASFFAVALMIFALYAVTAFFYSTASDLVRDLPRYTARIQQSMRRLAEHGLRLRQTAEAVLPGSTQAAPAAGGGDRQGSWSDLLTRGFSSMTEFLVAISFVPFLVYFMLSWQDHVKAGLVELFRPRDRKVAALTLGKIASMMRAFVVGNVVIGVLLGGLSAAAFAALRVPSFFLAGMASGFLSVMPYLGVPLAMVPPAVATVGRMPPAKLLAVITTVIVLHLIALNVLYPKLIGRRLRLNPLVVTIALLFWGWFWGAAGLILAIPITAALKIVFDHVDRLQPWGALLGDGDIRSIWV
ncbi:MAG TPA: AI-2E family transporter [Vicinamibacteria bacterium]|nr:AI-2E family transporter [Vicinamibacteria bacterium]